jgi:hypothetical protein
MTAVEVGWHRDAEMPEHAVARERLKLAAKLRWLGLNDEAQQVLLGLPEKFGRNCVVVDPPDLD